MKVEPIGFKNSNRELSIALLDMLVSIATYPGNHQVDASQLIIQLVETFPVYKQNVTEYAYNNLNDAENNDYEIYQLVGDLLYDIQSDTLPDFIKRCKKSNNDDIKKLAENWQ